MTGITSLPEDFAREHAARVDSKVHLKVLSNSAMSTYRACARLYEHKYVRLRRTRTTSEALRFGSFFHTGLNAYWITIGDSGEKFAAAVYAMRSRADLRPEDSDPYELVKAEELMLGYAARWSDEIYETISVEREFQVDLVNPETGAASRTYRLAGAMDVLARRDGKIIHVEHKTTSEDIGAGSDYWRMVSALDPQVSTYQSALKSLGLEATETLYDVIRKVSLIPKKATPVESRRYTKAGALDARQRLEDETPEEFRLRVRESISENPERYYARGPIVRLERDEQEHARDTWQTTQMIRLSENAGSFPRNPGACRRFHRLCEYFDVCSGIASIDDDTRFRTAERAHEELKEI